MQALSTDLRRKLEAAIGRETDERGARVIAEQAAAAALDRLDVSRVEARGHLSEPERELRKRIRARARQLGDRLRDGVQGTERLIEATAYEHWHRMLFARFLAENGLLIHPGLAMAVTLEECNELAREEGALDGWELAGRYASRMLPQIFRQDDPLLAVRLAPEHQQALEQILADLPAAVFTGSDSLGWVYQFWQARKKKRVNESEVKIGADELPAVTQLFTEPYMVQFLLQNTLGAWWVGVGRVLPVEMPFLRFLEDGAPAAGRFEGWPKTTAELKVLDPCCGSGHFLVGAFEILVAFRVAEGLSPREACDAVLSENLHGLELDNRCVQIAAFALAMAAWLYPGAGGYRPLPVMNVACSGLSVAPMKLADETEEEEKRRLDETRRQRDQWVRLGKDLRQQRGMGRLFDLFVQAPLIGSLVDPTRDVPERLLCAGAEELLPLLDRVFSAERSGIDVDEYECQLAAQGTAAAAKLLSRHYALVSTNVPYVARGKQDKLLMEFCEANYPDSKGDLANVFLERCLRLCEPRNAGATLAVMPQNWLFLTGYRKQRERLLRHSKWVLLSRLGPRAFEAITGEVVNVILVGIVCGTPSSAHTVTCIDVGEARTPQDKSSALKTEEIMVINQHDQLKNPDSRVSTAKLDHSKSLLNMVAESYQGLVTGDLSRFVAAFWEHLSPVGSGWQPLRTTVGDTDTPFCGVQNCILWEGGRGRLAKYAEDSRDRLHDMHESGNRAWGHRGVAVNRMGGLRVAHYFGEHFDNNVAVIIPKDPENIGAIWCFLSSDEFSSHVRNLDTTLKVTNSTLLKVPFDLTLWAGIAAERYPHGLPEPASSDPTQWLFKGTVAPSDAPLQVAVARLLGYRWPDQVPDTLDELADSDGIVCLPSVAGENTAAQRLRDLLRAAYSSDWSVAVEQRLLAEVGYSGRTLDDWLRNGLFEQHCKLFHHRPFVWHVWDGLKDGFGALVNYHRLDHKALESLTFRYLGDWINRQRDALSRSESGAPERLRRAEDLQRRLKLILEGEDPYDIFVRWKPEERQPIGWDPDLDDGVRLNIRPFMQAEVLRWKPNIKWGKDRGKNPPGSPWGEERDNDTHLKLADKRAARGET